MANPMNPLEMLNELSRLGYITPVSDNANLLMPTLYRSVPTITTYGTAAVGDDQESVSHAQLDGGPEGNIGD